jgi:fibronectin type 3 domain-containing protein
VILYELQGEIAPVNRRGFRELQELEDGSAELAMQPGTSICYFAGLFLRLMKRGRQSLRLRAARPDHSFRDARPPAGRRSGLAKGVKDMNLSARFNYLLPIVTICAISPLAVNGQIPVPSSFQPIYTLDQNYLQSFTTGTLTANGTPPPYAGMQCGSLQAADSNEGPSLLTANPTQQLLALQALGVPCIEVHVSFPLLYEPFMTSQGQSMSAFQTFYSNLATQIHGMGMKVVVESTVLFTSAMTSQAGWDTAPFYATLDWPTYQQARAQTALTIAQTMNPDYMVVLEEPDTESENSGQANVDTASGANSLLSTILASMQTERQAGLQVGAGVGTWLPGFQPFIQGFLAQPMDFIDMHIYPVNNSTDDGNFLSNALVIAGMAATNTPPMPISMTECWLHKELDSEVTVLTPDEVSSRNVFSFFGPLDQLFLQTMDTMASYIQVTDGVNFLFLNPFSADYFFAYLTYDSQIENDSPATLLQLEQSAAATANQQGQYTSTGTAFYNSVVLTPDTTPPSAPTNVSASSGNPTTALVTWNESLDNIGVAYYNVVRNGSVIAQTAQIEPGITPITYFYQDSNLVEATNYTYTIQAVDMAGNVSQPSQPVTVQTTNVTPPTTPVINKITIEGCTYVQVNWTNSTDKSGVTKYMIYMGLSPNSLAQIATVLPVAGQPTQTYSDQNVSPATTYYFSVQAGDAYGNLSYLPTPVSVTTPTMPMAPAGVLATPNSGTKTTLTWSAPNTPGGLPIAHYNVYRGTSSTALAQIAQTTTTTYNDMSVSPATTYYYAVQAADNGTPNSTSGLSSPVASVTTYALPLPPSNVTAVPASTNRMTVSWTETVPSGQLAIANYKIFRGPTATSLTQLTTVTKSPYNDQNLTADTTYCYALQAVDKGVPADISPMSNVVCSTTDGYPAAPTTVTATPESSTKITVSWNAAVSGGLPISNYHVYGGSSCASLTQLALTTSLTYNDLNLTPDTTYYFAVEAADSGGDDSPMSACVSATTYPLPNTPSNVVATAESTTMMSVTWTETPGALGVFTYGGDLWTASAPAARPRGSPRIPAWSSSPSSRPMASGSPSPASTMATSRST